MMVRNSLQIGITVLNLNLVVKKNLIASTIGKVEAPNTPCPSTTETFFLDCRNNLSKIIEIMTTTSNGYYCCSLYSCLLFPAMVLPDLLLRIIFSLPHQMFVS